MIEIKEFLLNYFQKKGIKVKENEDLFEKGCIDSLGIFRLILEVEVNFGKKINLEDIAKLDKVSINNISKLASL